METNSPRMPQPPYGQRGGGQSRGCLVSLGCLLGLSILFNLILMTVVGSVNQPARRASAMQEIPLSGKGKRKIAVIRLNGVIGVASRSLNDGGSPRAFAQKLERARKDRNVRGVLIYANSPGGSVTASDKMHHAMLRFKKSRKPVVVLMGDVCASGCVYATASANKILAMPTTITGSIGVIMSTLNFSELLGKIGVKGVVIASKKNKALLSPYMPVQEQHKEILKKIVDSMYKRFAGIVSKHRKIPMEKVVTFADGRVFGPKEAKSYKLVDDIGYNLDAKRAILKLAGLSRARFVRYKKQVGFSDLLRVYAHFPLRMEDAARKPSLNDILGQSAPKLYYMWAAQPR